MSEVNFLTFCITVIAITAISYGKENIAEKALSALSRTIGEFSSVIEKIMKYCKIEYKLDSNKNSQKSKRETKIARR